MQTKIIRMSLSLIAISMAAWSFTAVANNTMSDPNVQFLSPADGTNFKKGESIVVKYAIKPNPGGDHSHIYVNNKEAGVLRKLKGKYTLDPLPPGTHSLCLKVVNRGHASIKQGTCITVTRK